MTTPIHNFSFGYAALPPLTVRQRLATDEQTLWAGRPRQGIVFRFTDVFIIPFSLVWTALTLEWTISGFAGPGGLLPIRLIFDGMGILMSMIGVYLLVGRFFFDYARRRHTWYLVTSKRVVIAQTWPFEKVRSFELDRLADMRLHEGFGDIGTIRFPGGDETLFFLMGGDESWPWAASVAPPSFERIRHVRMVYDLIRKAQAALKMADTKRVSP